MKIIRFIIILAFLAVVSSGCGPVVETGRVFWGTSIRSLEQARPDGKKKTFSCAVEECYRCVMQLTYRGKFKDDVEGKPFKYFIEDPRRRYLVVMGVPGSVDTTEVGIFFEPKDDRQVMVNVASLSSYATIKASDIIFNALGEEFPVVKDETPTADKDQP